MISQVFSAIGAGAAVLTLSIVSGSGAVPVSQDIAATTSRVATQAPARTLAEVGTGRTASRGVPDTTSLAVLPYDGHYMGSDAHHRLVRFALRGGHITSFTVNGTMFPNSRLQGHQWHHTCASNLCTRGSWTTDTTVEGKWNDSTQGGDVHFTANLFAH